MGLGGSSQMGGWVGGWVGDIGTYVLPLAVDGSSSRVPVEAGEAVVEGGEGPACHALSIREVGGWVGGYMDR